MALNATEQQLKRIQEKLQHLLKTHAALQKENLHLKEELGKSKHLVGTQYHNIEVLKQQVHVLQLGGGDMNDTDKKEMGKRIDSYIKEIDRCIASLGD